MKTTIDANGTEKSERVSFKDLGIKSPIAQTCTAYFEKKNTKEEWDSLFD